MTQEINWKNGQILLPEHFQLADLYLRSTYLEANIVNGLGYYGLVEVKFDKTNLKFGLLNFESLKIITNKGLLLSSNDNLKVNSFNPEDAGVKSGTKIYLHIKLEKPNVLAFNQQEVEVKKYKVEITKNAKEDDVLFSFPFARIVIDPNKCLILTPLHNTQIASFSNNDLCGQLMDRVDKVVAIAKRNIKEDIVKTVMPIKTLLAHGVLREIYNVLNILNTIKKGASYPILLLYRSLYQYYVSLCLHLEEEPDCEIEFSYKNSLDSFSMLIEKIENLVVREVKTYHLLRFNKENRLRIVDLSTINLQETTRCYILLQKEMEEVQSCDLLQYKLSSPNRLDLLQNNALPGIKLTLEDKDILPHSFDEKTDVYLVHFTGEWDYVVANNNLSLFDVKELEGYEIYFYPV